MASSPLKFGMTHVKESLTLYQELEAWAGIAWTLSLLGRANTARGDYVAAQACYQESLGITMAKNYGLKTASYLEGLAGVVAAQGESAWAARLWGTAETLRETLGAPIPSLQRASYEHWVATARSQLGEKAFAAAWAEGRAMSPEQVLAAQQQVTLPAGQLPAAPTKSPVVYPAGLTAREVEILRLVAQGLTDAQVAEQLVISRRTVNWHLTSIYSKVQVTSRSAATRFAIEHQLT